MKTWAYWDKVILSELKKTPSPNVSDAPMFLPRATQCAIISNLAERTDIICKEFIKNGTWPFLSLEEAFCVRCRLENAYRLANALLIAQGTKIDVVIRPPDLAITPTEQVWEFFLFDWWRANATKYTVVDA